MPAQKIGTGAFTVAPLPEATVWLPGFSATGATYSLASTLTAFNNTDNAATVTYVGAWDALGESQRRRPRSSSRREAAGILDSRSAARGPGRPDARPARPAPRRSPRHARAARDRSRRASEGPRVARPRRAARLHRALPRRHRRPSPATSPSPPIECASGPEARRRVNLTLFNAGTETATFSVSAISVTAGPGGGSPPERRTRSRRSPSSSSTRSRSRGLPVCEAGGAWFRITATSRSSPTSPPSAPRPCPGSCPYEIFPARLDR